MDVEKMKKLIEAYDAFEVICDAISSVNAQDFRDGYLSKMYGLAEVIESFTVLGTEPEGEEEISEFDTIMQNMTIPSEMRAKMILGR